MMMSYANLIPRRFRLSLVLSVMIGLAAAAYVYEDAVRFYAGPVAALAASVTFVLAPPSMPAVVIPLVGYGSVLWASKTAALAIQGPFCWALILLIAWRSARFYWAQLGQPLLAWTMPTTKST